MSYVCPQVGVGVCTGLVDDDVGYIEYQVSWGVHRVVGRVLSSLRQHSLTGSSVWRL